MHGLTAPFTPATGYGNWRFLTSLANNIPLTTSFSYNSNGSGDLTLVTFPYKGTIGWGFGSFTYSNGRTMREVNGRTLQMSAGVTALNYGVSFQSTAGITFHTYSQVDDADGQSEKAWSFDTTTTDAGFGLQTRFEYRPHHYPNVAGETVPLTGWSFDAAGNLRILPQTDHPFSSETDHPFSPETDQCSPVKAISVLL